MQYKNGYYKILKKFTDEEYLKYTPMKENNALQTDISYFYSVGLEPRNGYEAIKDTVGFRNLFFNIYTSKIDYNNIYETLEGDKVYITNPKNLQIIDLNKIKDGYIMSFYTNTIDKIVKGKDIVLKNRHILCRHSFRLSEEEKAEWKSEMLSYKMLSISDKVEVLKSSLSEYVEGNVILVSNTGLHKDNVISMKIVDNTITLEFLLHIDYIIAITK